MSQVPQETVYCCFPSDGHSADGAMTVQRWAATAMERRLMVVVAGMLMLLLLRLILPLLLRRPCWRCTRARHWLRGALRRLMLTLCSKRIDGWRRWSLHGCHQSYHGKLRSI